MSLQSQRVRLALSCSSSNKVWARIGSNSNILRGASPALPFVAISTTTTTTTTCSPRYYRSSVLVQQQRQSLFLRTDATRRSNQESRTQQQQHPTPLALLFSTQATAAAISSADDLQTLLQQPHDGETAHHLVKAQEILNLLQQQPQPQQKAHDDDSNSNATTIPYSSHEALYQFRASLLYAWMERQEALLTRIETMLDDNNEHEQDQHQHDDDSNKASDMSSSAAKNHHHHHHHHHRALLLRQAVQAVKAAHDVLESMEPQLAPQHVVMLAGAAALGDGDGDDWNESNFLARREPGEQQETSAATSTRAARESSSSSTTTSLSPNPFSNNSHLDIDIALLGQSVLQAWARLLEAASAASDIGRGGASANNGSTASHVLLHRSRAMRGIPQRAQFLLERMVAIGLLGNATAATVTKPQRSNKSSSSLTSSSNDRHPQIDATECYNAVLKAWAYSQEHLRGVMAERVFQEMLQSSKNPGGASAISATTTPNGDSYRFIIQAWSWSRDRRAAFTATGHFMKMIRRLESSHVSTATTRTSMYDDHEHEDNDELTSNDDIIVQKNDMEPTLEDCHVLLQAWIRAEDKMSPTKAQSVLRLMENLHDNGYTSIRPDADCYLYVLQTCAQRPMLFDLGHAVVNEILQKLQNELIIPTASTYDAAICVWKNCALHPDANEWRQDCVEKTISLLQEMRMAHQRANTRNSISGSFGAGGDGGRDEANRGITTENINHVLEALSVSSDSRRTEQAEALLKEMEDNLTARVDATTAATLVLPTPNANSYRLVMNVWNSTKDREKLTRAKEILWRMSQHLLQSRQGKMPPHPRRRRHGAGAVAVTSPVDVLNAFVHLCASFHIDNQEEGMILIQEVLAAVATLKSSGLHPNAASYTAILQAARKLLPLGPGRQHVVEQIFILARDDGMVNETVLQEFLAVATSDQYARLVIAPSHDMEGTTRVVPEEWTRNAFGNGNNSGINSSKKGRVLSADGRRSHPLAVDGQMKMTKAIQDFKMRRLRDKRNRNLLRGGRWDRSQDKEEMNKISTVVIE